MVATYLAKIIAVALVGLVAIYLMNRIFKE
jgi:hypothetical protein